MRARAANPQSAGSAHRSRFESLPHNGYSRWKDLEPFVPFSRETLRKRELEGRFPRRVHISLRCCAWPNSELHRWFADPVGYRAEG
ncbi:helix-turn-helix transcriptional regulator [Paraburkholderia youngii]|uniref:helix-turn-helix transcriptional regulator n=1 Tax=Paraburkholderia youngii TaxID=2782701 RepID=UPI003D1AA869